MKIKILYEDSNILAIDKPSGISVHPDGRSKEKTISDWFLKNYPKAKNVGGSIFVDGKEIKKPGIVHRLDKETSGVLLLAKNQKAYEFLKSQFKNREIKKIYNAVVLGSIKDDRGTIRKPIGRSGNDFRKRLAGRGARGELREAITEYTVLKRFENKKIKFTYLEVRPKTGRTHQIRVHMKFINHPVVCDSLYNPNQPFPEGFKRLGLHAKSVEFKDLKGNIHKIESPLPREFQKVLK
ncbi:MAG: Pseudouridine synthase, RluA family [Candidatus Nomurabacteria bacterium GW2011_GWE1_32_28]|uniref:Pseudouridine synthase n=1 Tax=Candidatus Nomurabacteria bacterium GW2011_GWF1_31_48 TaxID=1618767 RepID=A0A0G0BH03_9BACT|nr:MAG: Pseudouridine synthase, RluA family [Candidatus Nomurabacteria bacterium GW2011_GWF2_30_133]KKP28750.1 MAG: Pseudouridine synthase, RluA family [Candidatus Nomurabacteria bacterium GW2011_GWE2_31_40]KKP30327.1 MAG: Pseudouridine synthase, RluA family [Candidatus Nomurabacteria bacterium GW2011_GWF1_31_48]KKP34854.1 MAG: Pseudouridine synthase, RluA family [Candidatus Nomurabacteria bacterium GW2011_GWE1_32_28]HAS80688.1 RluA family pseudouridine synthase [Candidatus Nomurabacteria bacte